MKRLRSSDDLDSFGEKGASKDWVRRDEDSSLSRSASHRSFYYKPENGRKGLSSSSSRYDRLDDERESSRMIRKRSDYESESYDRRKSYDRYRDAIDKGILNSSPRLGYGGDRFHRSESFSGSRREVPKGFRSERDRSRREGSVSSWRRLGFGKDGDEGNRSAGDTVGGTKFASEDKGRSRSPQEPRDVKSPPLSKDSRNEQSKSVKLKKSEEVWVVHGSSSEREEGELEPEPESGPEIAIGYEHVAEDSGPSDLNAGQNELESNPLACDKTVKDMAKSLSGTELDKVSVCEEKPVIEQLETVKHSVNEDKSTNGQSGDSAQEMGGEEATTLGRVDHVDRWKEENLSENEISGEGVNDISAGKSMPSEDEQRESSGIDLEARSENIDLSTSNKEVKEYSTVPVVALSLLTEGTTQTTKDKGKYIAFSPTVSELREDAMKVEGDPKGSVTSGDNYIEGLGVRGLELFSRDPVRGSGKPNQCGPSMPKVEKLVLEPLDLSLSLPNVLLPINSQNMAEAPSAPNHAMSAQSLPSTFQTNSDGFTMSVSVSGSQAFSHNPSCSMTQNSLDNFEQSVKSRPLFHGIDQGRHPQFSCDLKHKDVPMYQRTLSNGDGFCHQSQVSQRISNGQGVQGQILSTAEGSSAIPIKMDRQLSLHRQLSGVQSWKNDGRSSSQNVGSRENGPDFSRDKKHAAGERTSSSLCRSRNQDEKEQLLIGGSDFVESVIAMIVSEPVHVMSKRLSEMSGKAIGCLKEGVCNIILNADKHLQRCGLQKALQDRSDITLEMLLKSHRAQLEILVTLKTGRQEFLLQNNDASTSNLAEIFLNLRCKNLACKNLLPVDECDCKVCMQKSGFCSNCMCLVCSNFDMAYNTCSWVGCDVCSHWCHTNCALRESYIRNGHSAAGLIGAVEMQFHCVACGHPSEMFGFVKEVFQNFAKEWTAEVLCKELEYVKRIFSASEDIRGKQLRSIAVQMLSRLPNKSDLQEVQNYILGFLADSSSSKYADVLAVMGKALSNKNHEGSNGVPGLSQEALWCNPHYSVPQQEKASSSLRGFESSQRSKNSGDPDMHQSSQKEPVFDELESIVKIKRAEANMFQSRADVARREAEGLKRIAVVKSDRIEEEYAARVTKLRLTEAEEIHKQKLEELKALERAYREYFNMKVRMEADIKDLLLKMEATKRNLSM